MAKITLTESCFGHIDEKIQIKKYVLSTSDGLDVSLIDYGATIQSIRQIDRHNEMKEITLGYDHLQGYIDDRYFLGCTVGRVTNRIKNARFVLDGVQYQLERNDGGKHHLHGLFHKRVWTSHIEQNDTVVFRYRSPDGEEGYPGDVDVTVKYTLTIDHRLIIDYHAVTNKATPINLTNHAYFNLTGDTNQSILDHRLLVFADQYTPLDLEHIPTGEIASIENTPNDFRILTRIGDRIDQTIDGYNVMFVIRSDGLRPVANLVEEQTGRTIFVQSTQKGLQFYTGTYLDDVNGRDASIYRKYSGLCLETQNYTDSMNNQPLFADTILRPGEIYHEQTLFDFSH